MLGGGSGHDAAETADQNPERIAAVRALAWAYLRSALVPGDPAWVGAAAVLASQPTPWGCIDLKVTSVDSAG